MLEKLKIDSKLRKELDYKLLTVMIVIVLFGVLNIFLATRAEHGVFFTKKQLIWFGISMVVLYIILLWVKKLLQ